MKINVSAPINTLSFGFCTWNILQEFYKRNQDFDFFPPVNQLDFSAYNRTTDDFKAYVILKARFAREKYSRNNPEFKLWHIGQSEPAIGKKVNLMTFFELDNLTATERNTLNNHDSILVTSKCAKELFEESGVTSPVTYCPLGFDKSHFYKLDKAYYPDKRCVFAVFGKFEKRKHHEKVIKAWIKRFGRNKNYMLHAHIFNPFWQNHQQDYQAVQNTLTEGNKPFNVAFQPFVATLADFNDCINASSIVIDMSGGEGFSLPSFHAIGLGKHAVIHNCSAMKDWATKENAVLVPSSGKIEAYDGAFFKPGQEYNQGNIFDFEVDAFIDACEKAESRWLSNPINKEGLKLQKEFTWEKTADTILETTK